MFMEGENTGQFFTILHEESFCMRVWTCADQQNHAASRSVYLWWFTESFYVKFCGCIGFLVILQSPGDPVGKDDFIGASFKEIYQTAQDKLNKSMREVDEVKKSKAKVSGSIIVLPNWIEIFENNNNSIRVTTVQCWFFFFKECLEICTSIMFLVKFIPLIHSCVSLTLKKICGKRTYRTIFPHFHIVWVWLYSQEGGIYGDQMPACCACEPVVYTVMFSIPGRGRCPDDEGEVEACGDTAPESW